MKVRVVGFFYERRNGRFHFHFDVKIPMKVELAWYKTGDKAIVEYITEKLNKRYGSETYNITDINKYIDDPDLLWDLHNMIEES